MTQHKKSDCHDRLLRMFQERTGRTTIVPFREPSVHDVIGRQRPRVHRFAFVPRDME